MKNRNLVHLCESAKIYRRHYQPSLNMLRLLKSILIVLFSGSSPAASTYYRNK